MNTPLYMRYLFLLIACVVMQIPVRSFGQQLCSFKTDGTGKSQGLKIKFAVPCEWKDGDSKGDVLKTYQYEAEDYVIAQMISFKKPSKPVNAERMDELVSAEYYRKLGDKGGTFLWGRKLKIDGLDVAEVAIKLKKKIMFFTSHLYIVRYVFYHKNMAVSVNFAVTAETDQEAAKYFNNNKALFLKLASATDVLD